MPFENAISSASEGGAAVSTVIDKRGSLYGDLSGYYDQFCAQVDYEEQCLFAERAFHAIAQSGGKHYLDLACGSGQHLRKMINLGFVGHGLDNSTAMLSLAAERCPEAILECCDLAGFEHEQRFDLLTCFLYSILYSHPHRFLEDTLQRSFRALKPGGLLLFNAVDARGIRNDQGVVSELRQGEITLRFQSRWHYPGTGESLALHLRIQRESRDGIRLWQDQHTMTAVTLPELEKMLTGTGFETHIFEHDFGALRPWQGVGFNVIVAALRP